MADEALHDGLPEVLSIDTMANGAVYEMLGEAFKKLAANIADPNTDPTQRRSVTLKIDANPYKDRSGAELAIKVDTKLSGMKSVDSMMYVARRGGEYLAFGRNTNQTAIEWEMTKDHSGPDPDAPKKAN